MSDNGIPSPGLDYLLAVKKIVRNKFIPSAIIASLVLVFFIDKTLLPIIYAALGGYLLYISYSYLWEFIIKKKNNMNLYVFMISGDIVIASAIIYLTGFYQSPFLLLYVSLLIVGILGTRGVNHYILAGMLLLCIVLQAVLYRHGIFQNYMMYSLYDSAGNVMLSRLVLYGVINSFLLLGAAIVTKHFSDVQWRQRKKTDSIFRELQKANKKLLNLKSESIMQSKLDLVHTLVQGVAHEINNPLETILATADIMCKEPELNLQNKERASRIFDASLSIKRIVEALLPLGNEEEDEKIIKISDCISDILMLQQKRIRTAGIIIETDFRNDIKLTFIEGVFKRAILNILNNAIDAGSKGTKILVKTFIERKHAVIVIKDTGAGMSRQELSKIFSPFYTTKEVGEGYGLGMYYVYNFVKAYSGSIDVASEPGQGTTVAMKFPLERPPQTF